MRDGVDGLDGLSAYEIARAKGFVGSLDAWLASLKGPPGDKGEKGKDGQDGLDAPPVDLRAVAERAAALIPVPKDGDRGRDGDRGPRGPRGERGFTGKDAPLLAPAIAHFDRDDNDVTLRVRVVNALAEVHIIPRRDERGVMRAADIVPIAAAT